MAKRPYTITELTNRIALLEAAMRVARGTAHTIIHNDEGRAEDCQEAICSSLTKALLTPISLAKDIKAKDDLAESEESSLDENAPSYANNKDWDNEEERWASSAFHERTGEEGRGEFWERIAQACEHIEPGESKVFHLYRRWRGQKASKGTIKEALFPFLRKNGGEDMVWYIWDDEDGGYFLSLARGKHKYHAPVPDVGSRWTGQQFGSAVPKLRHPDRG